MDKKKLMRSLISSYGKIPDTDYFSEDILAIRSYYDYRVEKKLDAFYIDDITWKDLSMPMVFKRMNATQSTSGEQVLYSMLRTPALTQEEYDRRNHLINTLEDKPSLRLDLQVILARLGKWRAANTSEVYSPSAHSPFFFIVTLILCLGFAGSLVGVFFNPAFSAPLLILAFINMVYHAYMAKRLEHDLATARYAAGMVASCRKIEKVAGHTLGPDMEPVFAASRRMKSIARFGGISTVTSTDFLTFFNLVFLFDLLSYERLKRKLALHQKEIFAIHEMIGTLDAAIAICSYRKSVPGFCLPQIDFSKNAPPHYAAKNLLHPLIEKSVPNSLDTTQSLLVTGSNASGKSTFLKAALLNALLAQTICTALCSKYSATSFYIYSSMAISDSVEDGDSYFVAEIKSIKRIADAAAQDERILCVIDEVLRGTNTVERIAASSELLSMIASQNTLCLAATHDGELCVMLPTFRQVHFEESISDGEIHFDYLLKDGPATTRNAIKLLELLGFDQELVARSNKKAQHYLSTGRWE